MKTVVFMVVFGALAWHSKFTFSRVWSEASDLLLGDHLCEKSVTVKWIDVSLPHKRHCKLQDHKVLKDMAKDNPETEGIFEDNLIDTYYPQRPRDLENICLYDFVANYEWYGKNDNEIGSTANSPNLNFQTINCLILKKKMKE